MYVLDPLSINISLILNAAKIGMLPKKKVPLVDPTSSTATLTGPPAPTTGGTKVSDAQDEEEEYTK